MINNILNVISKVGELIAKGFLYIVVSIFSLIYNSVRIMLKIFLPILSKALVFIIVIVVAGYVIFNYIL